MIPKISECGRYRLIKKIDNFSELDYAIKNEKSVYVRHRPYPTAFIQNWSYRLLSGWMKRDLLYYFEKIKKVSRERSGLCKKCKLTRNECVMTCGEREIDKNGNVMKK